MRTAEYNFYSDPEAANIVLNKAKCPVNLLAIEASLEGEFDLSMVNISNLFIYFKII